MYERKKREFKKYFNKKAGNGQEGFYEYYDHPNAVRHYRLDKTSHVCADVYDDLIDSYSQETGKNIFFCYADNGKRMPKKIYSLCAEYEDERAKIDKRYQNAIARLDKKFDKQVDEIL